MSSDDYAQHLIQKYRLAVAIGIIQTKPEAKSLDQHIADLRTKINDDKMDAMTICSDDFDMDFNDLEDFTQIDTSQHSDTILKDFNDDFEHMSELNVGLTENDERSQVQVQNDENDIQSTFCETQAQYAFITRESLTDIDKTFCDRVSLINQDEIIAINKACVNITKPDKTETNIDKDTCKNIHKNQTIDTDITCCDSLGKVNQNKTANFENTFCENVTNNNINKREQHAKEIINVDINRQYLDLTTAFDSQATELYTLHTLTEDYTHVSQSQTNNLEISNRYIKGISKTNDNQDMCNSIDDSLPMHAINTEFGNNIKDLNLVEKININLGKVSNTMQGGIYSVVPNTQLTKNVGILESKNEKGHTHDNTEFCYNFKDTNLVKKISKKLDKANITKAVTENVEHKTQTVTDVNTSKNIGDNLENIHHLDENATNTEFEYNVKDIDLARKVIKNLDKENFANIAMEIDVDNFGLNAQADLNSSIYKENNEYIQETQDQFAEENPEQILLSLFETNISQNTNTVHEISNIGNDNMTMQVFNLSQKDQAVSFPNGNNRIAINTVKDRKMYDPNSENMTMKVLDLSQNFKPVENNTITNSAPEISKTNVQNTETMQVFDLSQNTQYAIEHKNPQDDIENESFEEVSEVVPFKVMEELNRVNAYLNRRIERRMSSDSSLDSGYRSDSQGKSKSALQLSGNWVGQSAYCLYEHITRCPMVATTQEIVEEISQVLGQLIDRLHEEESYPAFLEELLEHVDTLIRTIFMEEDMLLEKDEKIQRLFLLNKSIHIQKYSIEKLTDILETIHTSLTTKEDLHELTDIQEVENLSYIFHILEVLIKRHLKTKKIGDSQSQSQDENYPKRSTISDIWRKKWNPNYKEDSKLECSLDKKCVFTKCSEVLNKIVVSCLDGYSLIAYAALQCFNLLQF